MFNELEAYVEVGRKCAKAVNDSDGSRAAFMREHFQKMIRYEKTDEDKAKARAAYDAAYTRHTVRSARPVRSP
jgi:hypothetical protein